MSDPKTMNAALRLAESELRSRGKNLGVPFDATELELILKHAGNPSGPARKTAIDMANAFATLVQGSGPAAHPGEPCKWSKGSDGKWRCTLDLLNDWQ